MDNRPISFPDWKQSLAVSALSPLVKAAYVREILSFLKFCKSGRKSATVGTAKEHLAWRETQSNGPAREALRWFYRGACGRDCAGRRGRNEDEEQKAEGNDLENEDE